VVVAPPLSDASPQMNVVVTGTETLWSALQRMPPRMT
jgi:hypothetical protein